MGSPLARRPFCIRACLCKSNFSATHKRPDFGHLARWATSTCCLMYGCSPLSSRPWLGVLTNKELFLFVHTCLLPGDSKATEVPSGPYVQHTSWLVTCADDSLQLVVLFDSSIWGALFM